MSIIIIITYNKQMNYNKYVESALLIFSEKEAELGLQINWNKTKIQSLSDFLPKLPDLFINNTRVESVDSRLSGSASKWILYQL